MGVRAIRARIECDRDTLLALWRTHCVFNERLATFITKLFAMRRGEVGATPEQRRAFQFVARFIFAQGNASQAAVDLLNAVTVKKRSAKTTFGKKATILWREGEYREVTGEEVFGEPVKWASEGRFAFDKNEMRDGLPDSLFQPLIRDAVAYLSGHDELVRNWEKEHAEWLKRKAEWEGKEEHQKYLEARSRFDEFERAVGGKAGKRRERWHLYLRWLRGNPDLAGWRGGPAIVNALDTKAQARVEKAKPWKQRSVEAQEFWKANPELAALDRLHGYYEREYIRRRKSKKNRDGFEHRPTFTMPDPILHPRWALFNAPQTSPQGYLDLELPDGTGRGSARLRLLTGERCADGWPNGWVNVRFRADPRLGCFVKRTETRTIGKGRRKGETTTTQAYRFVDRQLGGIERSAQISGAKLILKDIRLNPDGSLKSATPYLVFACSVDDEPLSERACAIEWSDTGEVTKSGKKRRSKKLPAGLVTCAVDLGVRNLGFLTLVALGDGTTDGIRVLRVRNQPLGRIEETGKHPGRWAAGPALAHIGSHKREIGRLRRLRGKPIKGEESHIELQRHIDGMGKDRFKKAARAIVNFALNVEGRASPKSEKVYPRADLLILEKLTGLIPDAERERGINRSLVAWNRGQLVARVKEVAKDAGLKVVEVHPAGTSQCCAKCGALGRRYSIVRDDETRAPVIRFGWVEKLFACPNRKCSGRNPKHPDRPYTCNADHNASVNLHRRFVMDDRAVAAFFAWRVKAETERDRLLREIEAALRPHLELLHGLPRSELATPF